MKIKNVTVGELIKLLKKHHPDKEVLILVDAELKTNEFELIDDHDSLIINI
jgi:hypothetical protein